MTQIELFWNINPNEMRVPILRTLNVDYFQFFSKKIKKQYLNSKNLTTEHDFKNCLYAEQSGDRKVKNVDFAKCEIL